MAKSTFFTGQPVFNQLLQLIPRFMVQRLVQKHGADRYCKSFSSYDHLVTLLYSVLHRCSSLREVTTGMQASALRLAHLGLKSTLGAAPFLMPIAAARQISFRICITSFISAFMVIYRTA